MVKRIKLDLQAVENMLFFWTMMAERTKVSEVFILSVAEMAQFRGIYTSDFDNISVRQVMSALSNREVFRSNNKKECRFWVDNLWMVEDLTYTMEVVAPIKQLNVDDLVVPLNEQTNPSTIEELSVVVVPFYNLDAVYGRDKLYVNFFRALPEKGQEKVLRIGGKPLKEFIFDGLKQILDASAKGQLVSNEKLALRNVFY